MGASGWNYNTPYDPDPEVALQRLREETFAARDYLPPGGILRFPSGILSGLPWKLRLTILVVQTIGVAMATIHWIARGCRQPRSIDELLEWCAENGTHSILDITHTADIPEFGAATPLSKYRLLKYFGTMAPTRKQVDAATHEADIGENIRRWEAVYFAVYDEDGTPEEYVFIGSSGD